MDIRQIQPPLPTKTPPGKVCIVFFCIGSDASGDCNVHYKLCVVDLNSDGADVGCAGDNDNGVVYTPISPTLQIDTGSSSCPVRHAFCVLNQTLYVFEGFDVGAYSSVETRDQKSIFTYDLLSLINNYDSTTKTKRKPMIELYKRNRQRSSCLTKVGDMIHKKVQPSAVPTPDGMKILLLDIVLNNDIHNKIPGDVFELFDPVTLLSEHLPPIPNLMRPSSRNPHPPKVCVSAHGFVSMSRFVVDVPGKGMYVIDLEQKERSWKSISDLAFHRGKLVSFVIEDRFLFTTYGVHDIFNDYKTCVNITSSFVESRVPWYDRYYQVYRVGDLTLLKHDKDKGECYFCLLNSVGRLMDSQDKMVLSPYCNLRIDMFHAVYPKKGEDEEKPVKVKLELKSSRALKLSSEPDENEINPCFLFGI